MKYSVRYKLGYQFAAKSLQDEDSVSLAKSVKEETALLKWLFSVRKKMWTETKTGWEQFRIDAAYLSVAKNSIYHRRVSPKSGQQWIMFHCVFFAGSDETFSVVFKFWSMVRLNTRLMPKLVTQRRMAALNQIWVSDKNSISRKTFLV